MLCFVQVKRSNEDTCSGGSGGWDGEVAQRCRERSLGKYSGVRIPVTEMSNLELLILVASPALTTYSLYISHAGPGRNPVS